MGQATHPQSRALGPEQPPAAAGLIHTHTSHAFCPHGAGAGLTRVGVKGVTKARSGSSWDPSSPLTGFDPPAPKSQPPCHPVICPRDPETASWPVAWADRNIFFFGCKNPKASNKTYFVRKEKNALTMKCGEMETYHSREMLWKPGLRFRSHQRIVPTRTFFF